MGNPLELSIPMALALVTAIGYIAGRWQRTPTPKGPHARRAVYRARSIARELQGVSADVREAFLDHQKHLANFRERLQKICRREEGPLWDDLTHEAENLLKPTLFLSSRLAHCHDTLRQQTHLLMAITEIRTDPLTGLRNRRALDDSLQSRIAMFERYSSPFSIAVIDIDHFKKVNDDYGHVEGDRVLQEVAEAIDSSVRDTDLATRFGGEEFVVVMPETGGEGAAIFAERTRRLVEASLSVTISCGVAEVTTGDDAKSLLQRADEALYAAKHQGRNRVFLASIDQQPSPVDRQMEIPAPPPAVAV